MKYIDEYRDADLAHEYADRIRKCVTRDWRLMEVCGGQTHAIVRFGIDTLLPPEISLVHGPGCPVCVTAADLIDQAVAIAELPGVIFASFGDMLRVPGSRDSLFTAKSRGGDVRVVYSPMDALELAKANPQKQVVFFAVGFETTAPANAMAVFQAHGQGIDNFSVLVSHVLVPPAMEAILSSPQNSVQGFLAAGHVCTVMGYDEYEPIAKRYNVPIVVTGFEPLDILHGVYMCVQQLEQGRAEVENQYARAVQRQGNQSARHLIQRVFRVVERDWRGIGGIPRSGLGLSPEFERFDAQQRFNVATETHDAAGECISGEILLGNRKPHDCPAFATTCTPELPLGATMVSNEGACAAYYRYRKLTGDEAR